MQPKTLSLLVVAVVLSLGVAWSSHSVEAVADVAVEVTSEMPGEVELTSEMPGEHSATMAPTLDADEKVCEAAVPPVDVEPESKADLICGGPCWKTSQCPIGCDCFGRRCI